MKIRCPLCELENEEGTRFCSNCNTPLVESENPTTTKNPYIKISKKISRKVTLGIFVPVFMFFIFYAIAYYIGADTVSIVGNSSGRISRDAVRVYYYGQKTWPIWIIYLMSSCVFEYILFKDTFINKLGLIVKRIFKIYCL